MELKKEELEQVSGGYNLTKIDGRYYHYTGKDCQRDSKYVCPVCGRSVHYGSGWRYYCDFCDKSWFFERGLNPNISSGLWEEISEEEYLKECFAENEQRVNKSLKVVLRQHLMNIIQR